MGPEEAPEQNEDREKLILYISRFYVSRNDKGNQGILYEQQLDNEGFPVVLVGSGRSAVAALHKSDIALIVMGRRYLSKFKDISADGKPNGYERADDDSLGDFVPDMGDLEKALVAMGSNAPPILIHSSTDPRHAKEQYEGTPIQKLIVGYVQKTSDPGLFLAAVRKAMHPEQSE